MSALVPLLALVVIAGSAFAAGWNRAHAQVCARVFGEWLERLDPTEPRFDLQIREYRRAFADFAAIKVRTSHELPWESRRAALRQEAGR